MPFKHLLCARLWCWDRDEETLSLGELPHAQRGTCHSDTRGPGEPGGLLAALGGFWDIVPTLCVPEPSPYFQSSACPVLTGGGLAASAWASALAGV